MKQLFKDNPVLASIVATLFLGVMSALGVKVNGTVDDASQAASQAVVQTALLEYRVNELELKGDEFDDLVNMLNRLGVLAYAEGSGLHYSSEPPAEYAVVDSGSFKWAVDLLYTGDSCQYAYRELWKTGEGKRTERTKKVNLIEEKKLRQVQQGAADTAVLFQEIEDTTRVYPRLSMFGGTLYIHYNMNYKRPFVATHEERVCLDWVISGCITDTTKGTI